MSFRIGQEIVCVKEDWHNMPEANGPSINEVVRCNGFSGVKPGFIYLDKYKIAKNGSVQSFNPSYFRSVDEVLNEISIEECTEILTNKPELV